VSTIAIDSLVAVADLLTQRGMEAASAVAKGRMFAECQQALADRFGEHSSALLFVPGRVELLGKHTDYAGGRSLLCAAERGFCMAVTSCVEPELRILDVRGKEECAAPLTSEAQGRESHWSMYAAAVARRLALNFPGKMRGIRIAFASDLPSAAGMSSSSALIVGIFLAAARVNDIEKHLAYRLNIRSIEDLAAYLGTVENGQTFRDLRGEKGVGTFGGSQDHTAILCCEADTLSQFAFCPTRRERAIAFPNGYRLAIAGSGVAAEKAGAARESYNEAALRARALLDLWRDRTGRSDASLDAALASGPYSRTIFLNLIQDAPTGRFSARQLQERFDQFLLESRMIIPEVAKALVEGRLADIGHLTQLSENAGAAMLHNQIDETLFLAKEARNLGAVAASPFGAGWGGCVWALVQTEQTEELLLRWRRAYAVRFPARMQQATFFCTGAGPAAMWLES